MRSSAITSALIAKLRADSELRTLAPDGVFKDVAGASMLNGSKTPTRFVIVSFVIGSNVLQLDGQRAFQHAVYLVEMRVLSVTGGSANDGAARIDALLDPQPPAPPATLVVPGFALLTIYQEEPTEGTEFDDADPSIQWDRSGGRYRVWTGPASP